MSDREAFPHILLLAAFGDLDAASVGIISAPTLCVHMVTHEDCYLVVASDGVWEFLQNEVVMQVIKGDWGR